MTTLTKICGLNTAEALDAALNARADFVGFVFFPRSPRHVSYDLVRGLAARVEGRARKVALTVDADDALHAAIVDALAPDMLQLHGHETPERRVCHDARGVDLQAEIERQDEEHRHQPAILDAGSTPEDDQK